MSLANVVAFIKLSSTFRTFYQENNRSIDSKWLGLVKGRGNLRIVYYAIQKGNISALLSTENMYQVC